MPMMTTKTTIPPSHGEYEETQSPQPPPQPAPPQPPAEGVLPEVALFSDAPSAHESNRAERTQQLNRAKNTI